MHKIKNIVVGVEMPEGRPWDAANLTAPTRLAVRQAFHLGAAFGATVKMVCVLPHISGGFFGSQADAQALSEKDQSEAAVVLSDLQQQYAAKFAGVSSTATVTLGRPWLEILKASNNDRQTLIICGTRDHNAVSRLLFGTTGLKLLRNAASPVWLVKPRIDDDADLDVLAATDLGEVGIDVMHTGIALGQALPVRLTVMHVIDDIMDRHMARTGMPDDQLAKYRKQNRDSADQTLHEQLATTDYRTVANGVQTRIDEGPADACLLSAIHELDIDLLIMATAARGGIPGMLFGNTAERLLPELPCPIIDEAMIHRFLAYGDADNWGRRRRKARGSGGIQTGQQPAGTPDGRRTGRELLTTTLRETSGPAAERSTA
jgi:universal stress protein E